MQHRALHPVFALCTLTALAFGCHSDEPVNGPANLDSARTGWRSAELVMAEAGIDVQWGGSVTIDVQWSDSTTIDQNGVSTMVATSLSCPEGGSLKLDVHAQVSAALVATTAEVEFDGCGAYGVVLDGDLEIVAEVTHTKVSSSITGELSFSGDAEGTCEVDIGTTVTWPSVSSHASVCGFGYDELFV